MEEHIVIIVSDVSGLTTLPVLIESRYQGPLLEYYRQPELAAGFSKAVQ
ncbi:hypothetical protein [Pseudomonas cerasi]